MSPQENQAGDDTAQITNFAQTWHICWVWRENDCGKTVGEIILFPLLQWSPYKNGLLTLWESSFNMTRGGGGDEDIETQSLKF